MDGLLNGPNGQTGSRAKVNEMNTKRHKTHMQIYAKQCQRATKKNVKRSKTATKRQNCYNKT